MSLGILVDVGGLRIPHLKKTNGNVAAGVVLHDARAHGEGIVEMHIGVTFMLEFGEFEEFVPTAIALHDETVDAIDHALGEIGVGQEFAG